MFSGFQPRDNRARVQFNYETQYC
uniref:Uncharacterized protein n=1 Tax=Anguilla anguilla TaxID=7936 RepID=A0A0E9VWS1_ANGAN